MLLFTVLGSRQNDTSKTLENGPYNLSTVTAVTSMLSLRLPHSTQEQQQTYAV